MFAEAHFHGDLLVGQLKEEEALNLYETRAAINVC